MACGRAQHQLLPPGDNSDAWRQLAAAIYHDRGSETNPDMSEAQRQLQHAKEQLDLAGQYPGRDRSRPCERYTK